MCAQLCPTENAALTHQTMIVRLLQAVTAFVRAVTAGNRVRSAVRGGRLIVTVCHALFIVRNLPEASHSNILELTVLAAMCDDLIRVRTDEITFHTMKM